MKYRITDSILNGFTAEASCPEEAEVKIRKEVVRAFKLCGVGAWAPFARPELSRLIREGFRVEETS